MKGGVSVSTYQVWSESEAKELQAMAEQGLPISVMARKLGRCRESIRQKARHMGLDLAVRKIRAFTPAEDAEIMAGNASAEDLAARLGRSKNSVYARMRRLRMEGKL